MKILILNGSPRKKGNTITALHSLEQKLLSNHDIEFINLYDYKITPCYACYQCSKNNGRCIQKDDANVLLEKISETDLIIFGSPVYWWGISAQLKLLIDKFITRVEALQNNPKKIVSISIGASGLEDPQYKLIQEQLNCITQYLKWEYIFSASFSALNESDIEKLSDFETKIQEISEKIQSL